MRVTQAEVTFLEITASINAKRSHACPSGEERSHACLPLLPLLPVRPSQPHSYTAPPLPLTLSTLNTWRGHLSAPSTHTPRCQPPPLSSGPPDTVFSDQPSVCPLGSSPSGSGCSSSSLSGFTIIFIVFILFLIFIFACNISKLVSSSSFLVFLPPFPLPLPLPPGLVGWPLAFGLAAGFSQDAFPSNLLLSDPSCHNGCTSWVLDNSQPDVPSFHSWSTSCPSNLLLPPQVGQHALIPGHLGLEFWCNSPGLRFSAVVQSQRSDAPGETLGLYLVDFEDTAKTGFLHWSSHHPIGGQSPMHPAWHERIVKIQQPVTTSTYTKYGQRYWRQPANKNPKQAKPRQTCQRLSSTTQQGRYMQVKWT